MRERSRGTRRHHSMRDYKLDKPYNHHYSRMKKFTESYIEDTSCLSQSALGSGFAEIMQQLMRNQNEIIDWIAKENKIKGRPNIVKE